eukprot:scaffold600_cov193-Ochromonas_danica.AAC.9
MVMTGLNRMMIILVGWLLIVMPATIWASDNDYFDFYSSVLGERVPLTVASNAVLQQAVEVASVQEEEEGAVMDFVCGSYQRGTNLARSFRQDPSSNTTITPLVVDEEQDRMCFLAVTPAGKDVDPRIDTSLETQALLPLLKIHDSAYALIEREEEAQELDLDEADLVVSYRPEAFSYKKDGDFDYSLIQKHFERMAEKISTYTSIYYHDFFWSSPKTGKFLESVGDRTANEPNFLADVVRYKLWSYLGSYYEALTNKDGVRSYGHYADVESDPCNYEAFFRGLVFSESSLTFSTKPFLSVEAGAQRDACLANVLGAFANHPSVNFVVIESRPVLLNYRARSIPQTAKVGSDLASMPFTAAGLQGDGQIMAISDTGLDSKSCFFYDPQGQVTPTDVSKPFFDNKYRKIIQYSVVGGCGDNGDGEGGHGTHVSGIAVGAILNQDITGGGKYDGVAPNAKVVFTDMGKPGGGLCVPPLSQLYGNGKAAGARIFSNSFGSYFTGTGYYANQDMDNYLFNNMDTAIFYASGNIGKVSSITRESAGKNVVSVGSSETTLGSSNIAYIAFYSSRGPTYDNRLKPDIISPGDQLNSAKASGTSSQTCDTIQMTGTSMATPAAAGNALLFRQYFQDSQGKFWTKVCRSSYRSCRGFNPSGVLIKTVMAHAGSSLTLFHGGGDYDVPLGPAPDFNQGFGRYSLYKVLPLPSQSNHFDLFVADGVNIGEDSDIRYAVQISSGSVPLRVTIGWYDAANVQGTTSKALVNDLDLTVTSPSGRTYYPNNKVSKDSVNTLERVSVENPGSGVWKVNVHCNTLPFAGNQLFSIVITSMGAVSYA